MQSQVSYFRTKTKNPSDNQGVLVGLRSVADSNRRKWFCRPPPSHSVNRPIIILLSLFPCSVPVSGGCRNAFPDGIIFQEAKIINLIIIFIIASCHDLLHNKTGISKNDEEPLLFIVYNIPAGDHLLQSSISFFNSLM